MLWGIFGRSGPLLEISTWQAAIIGQQVGFGQQLSFKFHQDQGNYDIDQ